MTNRKFIRRKRRYKSAMSAARSVQRMPLPRRAIASISPICIRHTPAVCLRSFHSSLNSSPPAIRGLPGNVFPQSRQPRQRRFYATIIHNQKYNEDKVPLALEITPSCAKVLHVWFPLTFSNYPGSKLAIITRISCSE